MCNKVIFCGIEGGEEYLLKISIFPDIYGGLADYGVNSLQEKGHRWSTLWDGGGRGEILTRVSPENLYFLGYLKGLADYGVNSIQ